MDIAVAVMLKFCELLGGLTRINYSAGFGQVSTSWLEWRQLYSKEQHT